MSDSPGPSTFEHRVHTFTSLLAALICGFYDVILAHEKEHYTILTETIREASEDLLQQVRSGFPMSEHLSILLRTHLADAQARQNPLERLGFMWFWTFIALPVFLYFNCLEQLWYVFVWELRLFVRLWRCHQAHCQQALLIPARIKLLHELPDLTDHEADCMVANIAFLGFVADLLGVYGR